MIYASQVVFGNRALHDLHDLNKKGCTVGLADILYVFKLGTVVSSEKDDANGSLWRVEGETCHGNNLVIHINIWCDHYMVRVLRVSILGDDNA